MKHLIIALCSVAIVSFIQIREPVHEELNRKPVSILPTLSQPVYAQAAPATPIVPPAPPKPVVAPPVQATGTCATWLSQAGISDPDAVWLITKESGCRPTAQNPTSTAYGIFQFLDSTWAGVGCVKTSEPVQQMRCGQKYVMARYGSWSAARKFHLNKGWY